MTTPLMDVQDVTSRPIDRRVRICHVAYSFYESDVRIMRYAEAAKAWGNDVDVIALRRPGQSRRAVFGGVRVYRIQRRTKTERRRWTYMMKVAWFCIQATIVLTMLQLRRRYELVHVHNVPDFLVWAASVPKLFGAKVILDIHDVMPELYSSKFGAAGRSLSTRYLLLAERLSCRFADHVIVANDLWRRKIIRRAVSAERCTTLLNHPDLRVFKPIPEGERRRDRRFIILYPGTLNRHQGVDIAVRAFALVQDRMPDAEFHIYGEGPARAELARLAREQGLAERIKLMDPVPAAQIATVMASANVGVVPKRADGFGNEAFSTKVLEFMACAVPVIVARTSVDGHYFTERVVRFFAAGQEADLAEALLAVYERPADHAARVAAAREFAVQNSWQARSGDYRGVIDSLIGTSSRRATRGVKVPHAERLP